MKFKVGRFPEAARAGRTRAFRPGWLVLALLLAACGSETGYRTYQGETMGTGYQVTARCPDDQSLRIDAVLESVNDAMSTYRPESALSRFNAAAPDGWHEVPAALALVVDAALQLSRESAGAFDVTVGPLVNLWGFGPEMHTRPPTADEVAERVAGVGFTELDVRLDPPALRKRAPRYVDLSAIAKGHGVDRVAEALLDAGCDALLVDIGGEVRVAGRNPRGERWRVGVEVPDPGSAGGIQRIVELQDGSIATSGDYRNFMVDAAGEVVSHTLDPRTGYPVRHGLASVSVLHDSAMWADGYATLLTVMGPEAGVAFAQERGLSTLFVIRAAEGFQERYTGTFETALISR